MDKGVRKRFHQKPFNWIRLPDLVNKEPPTPHYRWLGDYTGILNFELKLLTPLHIGSGLLRFHNGEIVKEFYRLKGEPIIPGSSLKGAFRSVCEVISNSCMSKTKVNIPVKNRECKIDVLKKSKKCPYNLCPCCRLFGGLGYKGKVTFHDAYPLKGNLEIRRIEPLWKPNNERLGWKFYKHGIPPREGTEPLEVYPEGSVFKFEVYVDSLSKSEMNLLLTSMGILGDFYLKLGGAKPRCFGSIKVELKKVKLRNIEEEILEYQRKDIEIRPEDLIREVEPYKELIDINRLKEIRNMLALTNNRCPVRGY